MSETDRLTPECTGLVLLAAGTSARFALSNKLGAPFLGQPLGYHVVTALSALPFRTRIAVCGDDALDYASRGYQIVLNDRADEGASRSVRLGVAAARAAGCDAVVLALADMPRVTAAQVYRLFDAAAGADTVVSSSDGVQPKPPALFGAAHFDALEALHGDEGARPLIAAGHHIVTSADELLDVDTEADLADLHRRFERFAKDH